MLRKFFKGREARWCLSALEALVHKYPVLSQPESLQRAKSGLKTDWSTQGIQSGASPEVVALLALQKAAALEIEMGEGNFVYRGLLTSKGRDTANVFRTSTKLLLENETFDEARAKTETEWLADLIESSG